jgi:hypothetical protein
MQLKTNSLKTLNMKNIDYIIIGAQKAGTTSLHDLLVQHPKIRTTILKENLFFSNLKEYSKGINYFNELFSKDINNDFILGTSDVQLLHSILGPERLFKYNPNVKLIIILRNPVDRAYSAFNFAMQKEMIDKNSSFEKEFDSFSKININNYQREENNAFSYFYDGLYSKHIKNWRKYFPKENFFICTTKQLYSEPNLLLNDIFEFLGLKPISVVQTKFSNVTGKYRFSKLQKWLFNGETKFITSLGNLFSTKVKLWIRKNIIQIIRKKTIVKSDIPKIDTTLRKKILSYYEADLKELNFENQIDFDE